MRNVKIRFAYKAGFRRLWVVIAIPWLAVGLWRMHDNLTELFQLCVIPVFGLYLLGAALVWIVEGFAKADR